MPMGRFTIRVNLIDHGGEESIDQAGLRYQSQALPALCSWNIRPFLRTFRL